jgi:hypothetical protein
MPEMLFYDKPVPLNRETHRKLKIRPVASFAYAARVHSVPLAVSEFAAAGRQLPILFATDANQNASPFALLGLRQDENLFVDPDGRWNGNYIPAFIRRYPFVLFEQGKSPQLAVGFDEAFAGFGNDEGEPMFTDDGVEGPMLKRAIEFLDTYRKDVLRTQEFVAELKRLDLLVPQAVNVTVKNGSQHSLNGFSIVDEERLHKIDDKDAGNLLRSGALGMIHMHLVSMRNIPDLTVKLDPRLTTAKPS